MLFYIICAFGVLTLVTAAGVVLIRNPVRGAMSLVACLFCLSVLYLSLQAELIAALQVIVYAGAIMVLFVFVIMLVGEDEPPAVARRGALGSKLATGVKALAVALLAVEIIQRIALAAIPEVGRVPPDFGSVSGIGRRLFRELAAPFELVSLVLLVAVVGAVVLSKAPAARRPPRPEGSA